MKGGELETELTGDSPVFLFKSQVGPVVLGKLRALKTFCFGLYLWILVVVKIKTEKCFKCSFQMNK